MTCNPACLPSYLPGAACHPTPCRGGDGGTQSKRASVPVTKTHSGTLAHSTESVVYGVRRVFSVPPNLSVPPMRTTTSVRHAQKRTVSRARAGYQKANEEAATIIAGNPVAYPEGSLMAQWADMVTSRAVDPQDAKAGPLFEVADGRRPAGPARGGLRTWRQIAT